MPKMKMKQIQAMNNILLMSCYDLYFNDLSSLILNNNLEFEVPSYDEFLKSIKDYVNKNMKLMKEGNKNE